VRYLSLEVVLERVEAIDAYERDPRRQGRGERFDAELHATFRRIEETPLAFPRVGRAKRPILRRAKVMRFLYAVLYYALRGEPIIVAIAHGKRSSTYWRERLR
jgi:plasmid stabilization system protein ParE